MFPQMFQEDCYSFSIDYFSLGVIVYEMTTGKFPFPYQGSYERLIDLICNHDPSFPVDFDEDLKDLIGNKVSRHAFAASKRMANLLMF